MFEAVTIGSQVTADQINYLVGETFRVLRECPATSSVTYLGSQGPVSASKSEDEYKYSMPVPVSGPLSRTTATAHVLTTPVKNSSQNEEILSQSDLSWLFLARGADQTVGTYAQTTAAVDWAMSGEDLFGDVIHSFSFPVTIGTESNTKFNGALVAARLAGTWGYSGNVPSFVAFLEYGGL